MEPNFIIIYVDSPAASATFYSQLLGREPVESSPTFALFALSSGVMLGMWSKHTVKPAATATGGGAEVAFTVHSEEALHETYETWKKMGLPILQEPAKMEFGHTFVALDPDSHRLRVFMPGD